MALKFRTFKEQVQAAGLQPRQCTHEHWQIQGGHLLVNFYPSTGTIYVAGTTKGYRGTVADAIRATKERPKLRKGARKEIRKRYAKERKRLYDTESKECYWCHRPLRFEETTLDHKVPLSRGGLNNRNNYVLSCEACNTRRADKMPELHEHF